MATYILCEVVERDISFPKFFDNYDDAYDEMVTRVAQVLDIGVPEVIDLEDDNKNTFIGRHSAHCELPSCGYADWRIYPTEVNKSEL